MSECIERCARLPPHCRLELTRSIAPDTIWHWAVIMPDGHLYATESKKTFEEALEDMRTEGVKHLIDADRIWRSR